MKKIEVINIPRPCGLWGRFILRLKEIDRPSQFILWADIYEKLCRGFSLRKQEIRECVLVLRDLGLIDISPRGIKLNFEVKR